MARRLSLVAISQWIHRQMIMGRRRNDPSGIDLEYWREPPDKGLTNAYWDDPWPELQGMLTSDQIAAYNEVVGGMIRPFEPHLLKPASYELTLGPWCLVEGKLRVLSRQRPRLVLPKNSIVFVSMAQVLCLPHYVVGRFDLAINLIYQGLLLGTGPQVDPGFQGALGCPLHNISNDDIEMRLNDPFAKIDFVKTVPRDAATRQRWSELKTEAELARWLEDEAGPNARLFKGGKPEWREPIFGYTGGRRPTSSVQKVTRDVSRFRRYSVIGLITVFVTAATLVFGLFQIGLNGVPTKDSVQQLQDCQAQLIQELTRSQASGRIPGRATPFQAPSICPGR